MDRVICFDTSIGTTNMGDYIIAESCDAQLKDIYENKFVLRFPTHTPVSHWYQNFKRTSGGRYNGGAKYKFVYGTNLLNENMLEPTPLWNVNIFNAKMSKDAICVGVGMGSKGIKPNLYTRKLLNLLLSKEYIHSTRDERTAEFLRSMGFQAINTGCATTWRLTNEHCSTIPKCKAEAVVFTLTDYMQDRELDRFLITTLQRLYNKVYFWIQGIEDYAYFTSLGEWNGIQLIPPTLEAYSKILEEDIDFVGTRLHAGIKALQCRKRTIIIEVDNRASDMKNSINLPTIKRCNLKDELETRIQSEFETKLNIKVDEIEKWRKQFDEIGKKMDKLV